MTCGVKGSRLEEGAPPASDRMESRPFWMDGWMGQDGWNPDLSGRERRSVGLGRVCEEGGHLHIMSY